MNKTEWFQGRHSPVTKETSKALRIWLTPDQWLAFDNLCREGEWSRSHGASLMLSDWLRKEAKERSKAPLTTSFRLALERSSDEVEP